MTSMLVLFVMDNHLVKALTMVWAAKDGHRRQQGWEVRQTLLGERGLAPRADAHDPTKGDQSFTESILAATAGSSGCFSAVEQHRSLLAHESKPHMAGPHETG
ncbi:hypothetical protein OPT61_g5431 [Boeremia exigua]|uniref:Uncharacterized protein n=1 Tax=Boeremia exigua TaxID=749465 RepID=A0ACC2IAG1_9PLEO|nr:hypothetical protein OPT61_g5431 [Boeremia exigua]